MVERTGDQQINDDNWKFIELTYDWSIVPHPKGTGIAISVHRGSACEGHVHLVTCHCNFIRDMYGSLKKVVDEHKKEIENAIEGFVTMQNYMFEWNYEYMNGYKESISAIFMQGLANWLVYEAGKIDNI